MSEKNCDSCGRARSCTISFRVSPEEARNIDTLVSLSGMTKQDYIVSRLSNRELRVSGNCRIHRAVYDRLGEVLEKLQSLEDDQKLPEELSDDLHLLLSVIQELYFASDAGQ